MFDTREFSSLAEYSKATGQDRHSVLVDYDVFVNVRRLDAQDVSTAAEPGFNLKSKSSALYSFCSPHYGPRP